VTTARVRPAFALDELAHVLGALAPPGGAVARKLAALDEAQGAIERRPDSQLGDRVVLLVGQLPDSGVLFRPDRRQVIEDLGEPPGGDVVEGVAVTDV